MKLYTEGQVNELRRALRDIVQWDDSLEDDWGDAGYRAIDALKCFEKLTTIQSPSDEEIIKWIEENYKPNLIRIYVYEGIKWYREQLKQK